MTANFCKHCGASLTTESKFCSNCGYSTPAHTTIHETDYVDPHVLDKQTVRQGRSVLSRRTVFAISLFTVVMFVITGIADALGMEAGSPLAKVIAGTALVSFAITVLAWIVFAISESRRPTPEPKTPQEIALRQEAERNREKIIFAIAIIAAIILGIAALTLFLHIDLILTFTPTTTP